MAKILIVEDDDLFRSALEKNLQTDGHEVIALPGAKQALSVLNTTPDFDLIISDIQMPEINGLVFTKAIRNVSKLPIILMTGFAEIIKGQEPTRFGANEFLLKPFNKEQITSAISRVMEVNFFDPEASEKFCRLGIDDFATGRKMNYNVFVRLGDDKYTKIAHKGEDISIDRVRAYKQKGVNYLYLRQDDFRKYVGFTQETSAPIQELDDTNRKIKESLQREVSEIIHDRIRHEGADQDSFDAASAFVEACFDLLTEDTAAVQLVNSMRQHTDHLLSHSVGVSLFSVMICHAIDWNLPPNRFKVAVGGLLHDVGHKELYVDTLNRPRSSWSVEEVQHYERHPQTGQDILDQIMNIPEDVKFIVKQHHENCASRGFPTQMKKTSIHPMAKLIAVADEFCYLVVKNPESDGIAPVDAIKILKAEHTEKLDKKLVDALAGLFHPPAEV